MLNFIYYPVSFILWVWHKAFSFLFGETGWGGGIAWALSVMFLVFTLRLILYKPFVAQVRSMRKMQEFQPEIAKLRKKYANDRQKQAEEMQKLQKEHGVNPVAGCLPVLVQVPVFIGLFHVLREFGPLNNDGSPRTENYFFGLDGVESFNRASLFGAKLGNWVLQGEEALNAAGTSIAAMLIVMIPLMIAAGVFTHITARHSVARQTAAQGENPQTAIMNKLMLYVFPIGVVVGAPFLPLAVLLYWVSNNLWTLGQQYVVYRRIDAEESEKAEQKTATQQARAPKPGQKPVRPESAVPLEKSKTPGAKPIAPRKPAVGAKPVRPAGTAKAGGSSNGSTPKAGGSSNGSTPKAGGSTNGAAKSGPAGDSARGGGRPPARRPRKRR
ncbi:membrane protein insertase YidC [Pseudonocardia lacus]|uniref:membrane protein insertase YidC n=1 Tax=Pseudonocardia lacus TaxID=2835865 RepID=UPI001BDBECE9|nr:membrane protein insertase YidC [Pseudonocardia lacus]